MGTVSKALELLDILARSGNSQRLTDLAGEAKFDKATTRRLLLEMVEKGFVEQNPDSREYALGPALQMLGKVREDRFPLFRIVQPTVRALAEETGEGVHAAEYCAGALVSVAIEQSTKAIRVNIEQGQKLPLHATASGLAFLSASPPAFVEAVARKPLPRFTATTPGNRDSLLRIVQEAARNGYSVSDQYLEDGMHSIAAAIYGANGKPIGALAIALPTLRATAGTTEKFGQLVRHAAGEVSHHLSGKKHQQALRKAS